MRECKLLEVVEQSQGNPSVKPAEFPLCLWEHRHCLYVIPYFCAAPENKGFISEN